jgi:hypothetical protein
MLYGTISHGTLRPQDLIPAFLGALRTLNPAAYDQLMLGSGHPPIPSYAIEDDDAEFWESEDAQWILEDLTDRLGESAPEGHYFGALEGDGSDFGFWPIESLS